MGVERRAELGDGGKRRARLRARQERQARPFERDRLDGRELRAEAREQRRPGPAERLVAHEQVRSGHAGRVAAHRERPAEDRSLLAAPQRLGHGDAGLERRLRDGELVGEAEAFRELGVADGAHHERVLAGERAALETHLEAPVLVDRAAAERRGIEDRGARRPRLGREVGAERGLRVGRREVERRRSIALRGGGHGRPPHVRRGSKEPRPASSGRTRSATKARTRRRTSSTSGERERSTATPSCASRTIPQAAGLRGLRGCGAAGLRGCGAAGLRGCGARRRRPPRRARARAARPRTAAAGGRSRCAPTRAAGPSARARTSRAGRRCSRARSRP